MWYWNICHIFLLWIVAVLLSTRRHMYVSQYGGLELYCCSMSSATYMIKVWLDVWHATKVAIMHKEKTKQQEKHKHRQSKTKSFIVIMLWVAEAQRKHCHIGRVQHTPGSHETDMRPWGKVSPLIYKHLREAGQTVAINSFVPPLMKNDYPPPPTHSHSSYLPHLWLLPWWPGLTSWLPEVLRAHSESCVWCHRNYSPASHSSEREREKEGDGMKE